MGSVPTDVVQEFVDGLKRNVARWSDEVQQHVSGLKLDKHDTPNSPHKEHGPKAGWKAGSDKLDPHFHARRDIKMVKMVGALYKIEKHLPGEHDQKKHGHGQKGWADALTYSGGKMTLPGKRKRRKKLLEEHGADEGFQDFSRAVSFYTQGFFKDIRNVGAAMATDTLDELEANALGYFGEGLYGGQEDPTMSISFGSDVTDLNEEEIEGGITYLSAQKYAHSIANAIENATPTDQPLYRGSSRQQKIELKPGDTFDIPGSSSFTRDEELGDRFARGKVRGQKGDTSGYRYVVEVVGPNRAVDVDVLSPWHQQEALTNGRFTVLEVEQAERDGRVGRIRLRQDAVVDAAYTGEVSYKLPADVGSELRPREREAVMRVLHHMETFLGSPEHQSLDLGRAVMDMGKKEGNWENVARGLRKLGFWVGIDPSWSDDMTVVRNSPPKEEKDDGT